MTQRLGNGPKIKDAGLLACTPPLGIARKAQVITFFVVEPGTRFKGDLQRSEPLILSARSAAEADSQ
jgi:hypothetical protein